MNLSAWVLSIAGIVVLTVMVDIIIPEGKTGKYIKGIFAMVTVLVIAMPLPKIFNSEFDFSKLATESVGINADFEVMENIFQMRVERLENKIAAAAEKEGINGIEVNVKARNNNSFVEIEIIEINLKNAVIATGIFNINIVEKVAELASVAAGVDKSVVKIYGG